VAWDEIRQDARLAVHSEFGRPASYLSLTVGAVPVPCTVRYHTRTVRQGDLDREGYAQVVEDINRVIFLRSEVVGERGGVVTIKGRDYSLDFLEPSEDALFAAWNVIPVALTP